MIYNLIGSGQKIQKTDVLIIGGGTVGLIMASLLVKKGLKVIVLESGGTTQEEDEHELNEVIHLSGQYSGAAKGRFRCLGGTSTRWGGALIPIQEGDINPKLWPISHEEIMRYLPDLERIFGVNPGPYEFEKIEGIDKQISKDWIVRFAKWPSFSRRNTVNLISRKVLKEQENLSIYLNATATNFEVGNDSKLNLVTAQAPDGAKISVQASEVVIAAGAIESTRLLLLLEQQNSQTVKPNTQLGHYFHDHISVPIANLEPINLSRLNRIFGFGFEANGVMRNMRYELKNTSPLRANIPPCFVHVSFENEGSVGFNAIRDFFRYVQQGRIPTLATFTNLTKSTPWLCQLIWWRYIYKRLLYPDSSKIQVHVVIEQSQEFSNTISLSSSMVDKYRQPLATISWNISKKDSENITKVGDLFKREWQESNFSGIAKFETRPSNDILKDLALGGGINHPCGSTRMGNSLEDGVVNKDLRLFNVKNTRVVATSVLPSSSGSNPTMTLLLLALLAVDKICDDLNLSNKNAVKVNPNLIDRKLNWA